MQSLRSINYQISSLEVEIHLCKFHRLLMHHCLQNILTPKFKINITSILLTREMDNSIYWKTGICYRGKRKNVVLIGHWMFNIATHNRVKNIHFLFYFPRNKLRIYGILIWMYTLRLLAKTPQNHKWCSNLFSGIIIVIILKSHLTHF